MTTLRYLLPFLALAPLTGLAHTETEQCTINPGRASFGSHGSMTIASGVPAMQLSGGARCSLKGYPIRENWIRLLPENLNGGVLRNAATGDAIPFELYGNAGLSLPLRQGQFYNYSNFPFPGGAPDVSQFPLHARLRPANVAPGTYTATIQLRWQWRICVAGRVLGACYFPGWDITPGVSGGCIAEICTSAPSNWGTGVLTSMQLVVQVNRDCQLSAPAVNFGSAPLIAGFRPVQQRIQVRCSKGTSYDVGLSDGVNASGGQRRMASGGNRLAYELYKSSSGSERWGSAGTERRPSSSAELNPGSLDGLTYQGFDYRAEILPDQPTPPAGTYSDSVVVDVRF
ncbi:Spore coat protein U (SCPU) domain-containing protein [Pseudomonas citronellolis]|uniref:Spore coat protein U (SCPU) domain-containing protein n=1 Tax=Pseudomonas citronellolis TaxID=53408 RepID=A0AAQ1HJ68_9PSED|nr:MULTISPECIES: spore coat U domain-containing protein [Pseudomonas]MCL6688105.1 spore coat U domain-containing protein [Pseudomonas sp. R3.Fl]MCP1643831.1 spore coat protein U-like protein [Pseudomonas citronellolis]MCP1666756.1 spore coat protein U-like protein [Pseudomonas citronellolis]MCP1697320.1 spore coat protein U-like protein [Pseudomonas citronellolis]MCP1704295.1 spore coat protein U-like protein [Pseudomonas citronellolis]